MNFSMPDALIILGIICTVIVAIIRLPRKNGKTYLPPTGDEAPVATKFCNERSGNLKEGLVELKESIGVVGDDTKMILKHFKIR